MIPSVQQETLSFHPGAVITALKSPLSRLLTMLIAPTAAPAQCQGPTAQGSVIAMSYFQTTFSFTHLLLEQSALEWDNSAHSVNAQLRNHIAIISSKDIESEVVTDSVSCEWRVRMNTNLWTSFTKFWKLDTWEFSSFSSVFFLECKAYCHSLENAVFLEAVFQVRELMEDVCT